MRFPDVAFLRWAKTTPGADINLARSSAAPCPPELLRFDARQLAVNLPMHDGYGPLVAALALRYRVEPRQVFTVSGGAGFATWIACAAALDGCGRGSEVLIERPTYEPLLRIAEALGASVRRFDRRWQGAFAIDVDRVARAITPRTRLAIVTNLHNPSGVRCDGRVLADLARRLARVGAHLLVDEVYAERLFARTTDSAVHAGANVIATNSLTKAYGLDGLRAGWMLGPPSLVRRAWQLQDLWANHNVAPAEQLAVAALAAIPAIRRHARRHLARNRRRVARYFAGEPRLSVTLPSPDANLVFPRLPRGVSGDALAAHLAERYSTLVVPGRFFEAPQHIRFSIDGDPAALERGLRHLSLALDALGG